MNAATLRTGMIIALLAGGSAVLAQDQLDKYRTQMANMSPQAPATAADGAIAAAIAQWRALQQTDALPFDSYAGFVMAHPGWPGQSANRRAAERQAGTASPGPPRILISRVKLTAVMHATTSAMPHATAITACWSVLVTKRPCVQL